MGRDSASFDQYSQLLIISIHAPRMGRDNLWRSIPPQKKYFNPRAPYGARPFRVLAAVLRRGFQSTRPVWGATVYRGHLRRQFRISIHAPRMGRDLQPAVFSSSLRISIHAPRMGRDLQCTVRLQTGRNISIHAPRMGRDYKNLVSTQRIKDFNPRAPYGARLPDTGSAGTGCSHFNPRAPYGARLTDAIRRRGQRDISIHAPRMGRDRVRAP